MNQNPNVSASWNATSWLGVSRAPQQTSLKRTIQAYKGLSRRLKSKLEQLSLKREAQNSKGFVMVPEREVPGTSRAASSSDEPTSSPRPPDHAPLSPAPLSPTPEITRARLEESDYHHGDLPSLVSTITNILIESVEIRLSYVMEAIDFLTTLYQENPKQRTPPELMLARYEEWVQTNQRLFELNSRLYDLEKVKFDQQKRAELERAKEEGRGEGVDEEELHRSHTGEGRGLE